MPTDVVMPQLSDSMQEGTILQWLVSVGDEVAVGDELVEIEADKANVVYESEWDGVLIELAASEGEALEVGAPIARLGSREELPGDAPGSGEENPPEDSGAPAEPAPDPAPAVAGSPDEQSPPRGGRPTPLARRLAATHGVELSDVEGSGVGGRVVKADVLAMVPGAALGGNGAPSGAGASVRAGQSSRVQHPSAPSLLSSASTGPNAGETGRGAAHVVEPTKVQRAMATRMTESKGPVPHFYISSEVDVSACVDGRRRLKRAVGDQEPVPTFNDMVVKACGLALREFPQANAAYREGSFELYSRVNIGIAVAAGEALFVPTVFDVDRKGLREIASESRRLAQRVAEGTVNPAEMSGGTFTVSNLGMYGIQIVTPVITAGQAAILGVGAITERAVVRDGELATVEQMTLTLAGDHRILTGVEGAELLSRIRILLEEPLGLAL